MKAFAGIHVVSVTAGHSHAAAMCDVCLMTMKSYQDGSIYVWGDGQYGRLGLGDSRSCSTPKRVTLLSHLLVTGIACSEYHTVCLCVVSDV